MVWGKRARFFAFVWPCLFHSTPFQSTMPPLFFLRPHSHTTTHHNTPHTTCHTSTPVCCPLSFFLCDCQCTQSTLNQTTQHHAIMQSPHMAQPMDDAMSEWERAVVIEDTTPQTPSTTMKWWWHSLHLVSLVAWIGHPHSSQHHKGKSEVKWQEERGGWRKRVGTRKGVPLLCACLTSHKPFASCLKAKKEQQRKRETVTAIPRGKHHFSSDQWS